MRQYAMKGLAGIVLIVALAGTAGYAYLRNSLPLIDGTTTVPGLTAPVDIIRDADAIPHVIAANKLDALFGLGYVHAQDRLWQMEFQRRIGHGRLSEVLGAAAVPQDRFLRTVGFGRAARAAWASTPDWAKQQVNAYISGVNAFIAAHHGSTLPPEFSLLRYEPEAWTGPDVIVWIKMMAWDLSANYSFELLRRDLVGAVGPERMAQLMPPYASDGLSILGGSAGTSGSGGSSELRGLNGSGRATYQTDQTSSWSRALVASLSQGDPAVRDFLLGGATTESLGSNNWVVDGTLTASGKPLLANDPHLSTRLPSTWYLAHVSGGQFDVIGATLPGVPAVALGRNRFIAWGATNVAADVEDLFRERLDATGRLADYRGVGEPVTIIPETIRVKGGGTVQVNVRVTRHGPLISDAINANATAPPSGPMPQPVEPLALRWTALDADDSTLASFLKLDEAHDWSEFTDALRDFVVPSQNLVYADVEGHIGYYAPGRIPIRAMGDGSLPAEGWTGAAEWIGWIPFDELPHVYDPPDHLIVTANHRPAPSSYPHMLGLEWTEPYRAQRILDLLRATPKLSPNDMARVQADTISLHAKTLVPLLLERAHPQTAPDRQAVAMLRQWDGNVRGDSAAAAIFEAWFHQLAPLLVGNDLGAQVTELYAGKFSFVTRFLKNTLASSDNRWCDDVRTPKRETCEEAVTAALDKGIGDLTRRIGGDMTRWRWDAVHHAMFPHQGLDGVALLRPLLSRSVPNGGDWSTINVGPTSVDRLFEQRTVPGYREIIDLSPANDSRFLDAVGESGHFLSKRYDDFLVDWHEVRHRKMRMDREDIERDAIGNLRLIPER